MKLIFLKQIRYLCPLFAILVPIMAISGAIISPPDWSESSLRKYDYKFKILIGISSRNVGNGDNESQTSSRSYILFPSFKSVEISRYSHRNRSEVVNLEEASEVKTEEFFWLQQPAPSSGVPTL